ncbi:MAG TPA: PorP/SprF family type IX secretion system membrane protein [Bacteroidia bacterium]|nr:PorP/SprF family type IX secretion system membrane protein [Bacteroidia bacterium]HNS11421.1 PorP/SprF family type IX secretion system membrane protein [Bacteroidia bacterium]
MKNILHAFVVLALLIATATLQAQDAHFSQFATTPLQVNPAQTGIFDGVFRLSNNYRSQWSGLGKGYSTIHVAADAPLGKGNLGTNFFGVGLMVYQDRAGSAGFKNTIIEASGSYVAAMDNDANHYFSIGFQVGLNQMGLDRDKATWDSQWNGDSFDPTLPSLDNLQLETFTYLDFNGGVLYYYVPDGINTVTLGASMSHIGSPNVSFYAREETPLRRKITLHGSAELNVTNDQTSWINPRFHASFQGKQKEIIFGALVKNKVQLKSRYTDYQKEVFFSIGGFYRVQDAFILATRFDYHKFGLGISYDINASGLRKLSNSASAWEFNLSFVAPVMRGRKEKNFNKMPKFL